MINNLLNDKQTKIILSALKNIKYCGPSAENHGICKNVMIQCSEEDFYEGVNFVMILSDAWSRIGYKDVADPIAYSNKKNLWDTKTKYGKARWKLLNDLIEYYERI